MAAAKWFHKELDESYYFSNEADHFINEDFSSEEADAFLRHQDHQLDILKRFEQMPEDDRRTKNVLSELRMGLNRADEAESWGEPGQPYRDTCVINASIMKDRDKWGMTWGVDASRGVQGPDGKPGPCPVREHSQIEASQEAQEAAEPIEEATESAEPRPATGGAQDGAQRPWWRRVLGR